MTAGEVMSQDEILRTITEMMSAPWWPRVLFDRDRLIAALNTERLVLLLPGDALPGVDRAYGMRVIHTADGAEPIIGLEPDALSPRALPR